MMGWLKWVMVVSAFGLAGAVFGQGLEFSGLLDSTVSMGAGAGEGPDFFYGFEEYANLRMQAKLREGITFYGALNLTAAAGSPAEAAAGLGAANAAVYPGLGASSFSAGENYAAALELERLYFRVNGEYLDGEAGLMRLAFGYGQVWGPSDFLNPRNPLYPDARPRAILGAGLFLYPGDKVKIQGFAAAPRDPLNTAGEGAQAGLAGEIHGELLSIQALYAFESPRGGNSRGIHRGGLSLKADMELGLVADLLYTLNPGAMSGFGGLAASAGFDYSLLDGNLYILAEYLYNGAESVSSREFSRRHYLYVLAQYRFTDYTNAGLACVAGLEDLSFAPVLTVEHDLFQGFTLSLSGRLPLDREVFSAAEEPGELGPVNTGTRFLLSAKVRLRF
jgi:hypothetical protein